jgi:selenocysteine lyase/cysteine desulfurase
VKEAQADPMTTTRTVAERVAGLFPAARGYLNTATCGLPPEPSLRALERHLAEWREGRGGPVEWGHPVEEARALFAGLLGVPPTHVAVASQVSATVGMVAASLPAGATVLLAEGDFTSLLWPFLVQRERGVRVRVVPLAAIPDAVDDATTWVAVSAVQSADGDMVDLPALREAADRHGTRVLLNATQAAGWLPLQASAWEVLVADAYKWLLCPKGVSFAVVRPDIVPVLTPALAGWYAGGDPHANYYGTPLHLAPDATRFDVSPAWSGWAAAVPSLQLLADLGVDRVHAHAVGLADSFRGRLGLAPAGSAIVSVPAGDRAAARLHAAGVAFGMRAGAVRLGFSLYNDADDVDVAAAALE